MNNNELIPLFKPEICGNEVEYVIDAINSTWISGGPYVERFENDFRDLLDAKYTLTAANGTSTIHMAYLALDIKPGDEVIIPGFAFLAAANVAILMNAIPIFADIDPDTWCVTAQNIEKCISSRTKAIVLVHTYGNLCDLESIINLANSYNIPTIEDTAEGLCSTYNGKFAGTFGSIGTFSFQATKTITTGEGGMVVTNDLRLYEKMALYRSHGLLRKKHYWHELPGHNFRLTNMQAALGCAQLEMLEQKIIQLKRVHKQYLLNLSNKEGLQFQYFAPEVDPVLWMFAIKLDTNAFPQGRDMVMQQMRDNNIETRPGFYTPYSLSHIYNAKKLPVSQVISDSVIVLPSFASLSNDQIEYICKTLMSLKNN